ncbi:hypothetical protein Trydic_g3081 [Trypoxylus dichotomus]
MGVLQQFVTGPNVEVQRGCSVFADYHKQIRSLRFSIRPVLRPPPPGWCAFCEVELRKERLQEINALREITGTLLVALGRVLVYYIVQVPFRNRVNKRFSLCG